MTRLVFLTAKILRIALPGRFLHTVLRAASAIPGLGPRLAHAFDPNNIRKVIGYSARPNQQALVGDRWTLWVDVNDHIGYTSFLKNEPFEMAVLAIAENLSLTDRSVVLDIGANIGSASIPLCATHNLELVAVEASKENAALLTKNIVENRLRAQVHMLALSDSTKERYLNFYIQRGNTGANSLFSDWHQGQGGEHDVEYVPVSTLDGLVASSDLNVGQLLIVKIDVEGAEAQVLQGGDAFLKENSAPIVLEYRRDATSDLLGKDLSEVANRLLDAGYSIFSIELDPLRLGNFEIDQSYENIVAVKDGTESYETLQKFT